MVTKNIIDETTKYVTIMRETLPTPRKDYIVNGVIHYAALRDDMDTINRCIEAFNVLRDLLEDMSSRIGSCADGYAKAKKKIAEEISPLGKFTATKTTPLATVLSMAGVPRADYVTDGQPLTRTPIEGSSSINAIHVDNRNQVRSDGCVYYIRPMNRFALRINGHLILGNIGDVFTHGCAPHKIKPCSNGKNCRDTSCSYYHPDAGDIRNFISGSFSYQRKVEGIARRIGNRSTLGADIEKATKTEIDLFQDQSTHDFLCHLAILDTTR
jgi:hypothetical protein